MGGAIQWTDGMKWFLRFGYATAGTDTGHQGEGLDLAMGHPEKMIDFGYRSIHEMTFKSKEIIKAFYNTDVTYAYFFGCSTGGRQALMEAQRYPEDIDGIIVGAPAIHTIRFMARFVAYAVDLYYHPEKYITSEKASLVNQMVMDTCGILEEGFLNNPHQCKVDFSTLLCAEGTDDNTCLTESQLKTVETFCEGAQALMLIGPAEAQKSDITEADNIAGTGDIITFLVEDLEPDATRFVSVTQELTGKETNSSVNKWNSKSGSELFKIAKPGFSSRVAFSPDGSKLAVASGHSLDIWNTAAFLKPAKIQQDADLHSIDISHGGSKPAIADGPSTAEADARHQPFAGIIRITNVDLSSWSIGDTNQFDENSGGVGFGQELAFHAGDFDYRKASPFGSDTGVFVEIECLQDDMVVESVSLFPKSFEAGLWYDMVSDSMIVDMEEDGKPSYHAFLVDAAPETNKDERIFKFDEDSGSFRPFIPFSLPQGKSRVKFQFANGRSGRGTYELSISVKRRSDPAPSKIILVEDLKFAFMDSINNDNCDEVISHYSKIIEISPEDAQAYNNMAWLLATCPDDRYRNGLKAIELYEKCLEIKEKAGSLDTLAASYAEAGRFEDAIVTQEKAIALLRN